MSILAHNTCQGVRKVLEQKNKLRYVLSRLTKNGAQRIHDASYILACMLLGIMMVSLIRFFLWA